MSVCVGSVEPVGGRQAFVLHVTGALDWAESNELGDIGAQLLRRACGPLHLRIDLGTVTGVDVAGLRSVETLAMSVVAQGGRVTLGSMSLVVFRLLELAGVDSPWLTQGDLAFPLTDGHHRFEGSTNSLQ